jgi:hypothetical protein
MKSAMIAFITVLYFAGNGDTGPCQGGTPGG